MLEICETWTRVRRSQPVAKCATGILIRPVGRLVAAEVSGLVLAFGHIAGLGGDEVE
jgi:hypothetical protein